MENYKANYDFVISRLEKARQKETSIILADGALKAGSVILALGLLVSVIESLAHGDVAFRTFLFSFLMIISVAAVVFYFGPGLLRAIGLYNLPTIEAVALKVGDKFPNLKDKLCNGIQLINNLDNPHGTSRELAIAAFGNITEDARSVNFTDIVDSSRLRRSLFIFMLIALFSAASFGVFQNQLGSSLNRVVNFRQSFLPPAPFSITIDPLDDTVLRGSDVIIKVKASGIAPEKVTLHIKENKQKEYDSYELKLDTANTYTYKITSLKSNIQFYGEAKWMNSSIMTKTGKIKVVQKPMIRSISGRLAYPSYTKMATRIFDEQNADVSSLAGSRVGLNILANKDLKRAEIVYITDELNVVSADSSYISKDTLIVAMKVDGKTATGGFTMKKSGMYFIRVYDKNDKINQNPITYSVVTLSDAFPSISLLQPSMDIVLNEDAMLPIRVAISDDYGFSKLKLCYRLIESAYAAPEDNYRTLTIPLISEELAQDVPYLWDLNEIGIAPEDRYEFYVEIYDNDIVNGPKSSKTHTLVVRLPSIDEVLSSAEDSQREIQKDLQKLMEESNQVKKEMEELNRELLKDANKPETNWKDKKKMEDLMKKQADLKDKLSQINQRISETTKSLQENNLISQETLNKYMELQRMLQQMDSPELRNMQEQLKAAMDQLSPDQMRKALENFKFDEEKFLQSIERTKKLLQRMQAEQKTDELVKRAEDLANRQEELNRQMDNTNPENNQKRDELSKKQDKISSDFDKLLEELRDLEKMMKEAGEEDMPMDALDQAKNDLSGQQTKNEMQNSSQQMQSGDFSKAGQSQQQAKKNLKKFAQSMKKMKQQMQQQSNQEAIRKMQKATQDMLELSNKQEDLQQQTKSADYNSTRIPDIARSQQELAESMANVATALMELGRKSFSVTPEMAQDMGEALQNMNQSISELSERRISNAAGAQASAMAKMNSAIGKMQEMISQMQQGGGACNNPGGQGQGQNPGGANFSQQIQKLAAQQQMINQALQQMASGQQGSLSQEQRAKMGRISKQQGSAQKSLNELAKEQKEYGGQDRKTLGDLQQISKDMQETISDLQNGNITPETLKRQEKILSRLLDATKSIHDRDFDKTREAKTGRNYNQTGPASLDLSTQQGRQEAMQQLLQSIQQGYTKDYENLIRLYFDALQNNQRPANQ